MSICCSSRAAALAQRLAIRLDRNLGVQTLFVEVDSAPISETWEEGACADAVLLLLDSVSAPPPMRREAWSGLIDHDGEPPIAFVRLGDCAYPKLLDRRRFFPAADPLELERAVERWLAGLLPPLAGISAAPISAAIPDHWWHGMVDSPGQLTTTHADAAQAFAHQAARHFQGVAWIGCAGRDPAVIRAELGHHVRDGRMLAVLAHIDKPLKLAENRHSYLQLLGAPPELPGDAAIAACYGPAFPGWLATELGADLSNAVLLDATRGLFRSPRTTSSDDQTHRRHLEILHRHFKSWKTKPDVCRELLAEVPSAVQYGFAADWTLSLELCRRAAFLLLADGRRREGIRMLHRLLLEAEEHGDAATAEEARYELSWLTDDDEPARSISSPGEQLTFGLA